MYRCSTLLLLLTCVAPIGLAVKKNQPNSDSRALVLAAQSIAALTGGSAISDVTLTGSVVWNGSDAGTATLKALGIFESRMDLTLSSGMRTEIRDAQTGTAIGEWANPDSTAGRSAFQNCQTDAVWFFPALGSLTVGPNVVLSYIGQETRSGETVQHIRSYTYSSTPPPGISMQQLSTMDLYLDATTFLPAAIAYNAYPDDGDSMLHLPTEVDFSNYQSVGGVLVPMHIQRYLQGNLLVDVTITNAAFNTGLSLSDFTVTQAPRPVIRRTR
jgi:hypothetical protein